jgi:hypothetical protein
VKTPEELAEEYLSQDEIACDAINHAAEHLVKHAFLAGYQAAKDQLVDTCDHILDMEKMVDVNYSRWISVKERLPEEGLEVLVYGKILNDISKALGVRARFRGDQEWKYTWESEDIHVYNQDDVTHWKPLPEPPKDDTE